MSLESKDIEARKEELQVELSKVENQLVEALKKVESLKQTKFSIAGAIALVMNSVKKLMSETMPTVTFPKLLLGFRP